MTARNWLQYNILVIATFPFSEFISIFPDDDICLEEIKRIRYPKGIFCLRCRKITKHFKLYERPAYSCEFCRHQTFPLAHTTFHKSTTSLRLWFYCLFILTHTHANISVRQLQKELGVTYKTAWRMYRRTRLLMEQNNADLLSEAESYSWTFFKKIEFTLTQKQQHV